MSQINLYNKARWDFEKAKNKAFFSRLMKKLFSQNDELLRFDEVKHLLAPHGMAYRGVKSIPLDKIVGSEGRYQDFDTNFLPLHEHNRQRWENIDLAHLKEITLPPIKVYKVGDFYFVRDGNHRVSVARQLGMEFIDAEITELFVKVPLQSEKLDQKSLLIAEGYRFFLEKTHIDKVLPHISFSLTNPWGYYRLVEHINTYKYLLEERLKKSLSIEEASKEWFFNLYKPVTDLILSNKILKHFPGRTAGDLYIWIMDHWHYLKERYGPIDLITAMEDYTKRFGKRSWWQKLVRFFSGHQKGEKENETQKDSDSRSE
ncbi:hypothetical protein BREVNS_2164 [Brevinematales bacterium NS]|nr:transcriptional regulator [Brevinematales bacterium]QJR22914.1 hypothetical protein BREVNS_2164 [Brevinematales bacterium NS]